jgi:hypothetical protein
MQVEGRGTGTWLVLHPTHDAPHFTLRQLAPLLCAGPSATERRAIT